MAVLLFVFDSGWAWLQDYFTQANIVTGESFKLLCRIALGFDLNGVAGIIRKPFKLKIAKEVGTGFQALAIATQSNGHTFNTFVTPYTDPTLPPASDSIGNGMPSFTILDNSLSTHILCTKTLSILMERISTPSFWKSGYFSATAEISVAQTNVKSPG